MAIKLEDWSIVTSSAVLTGSGVFQRACLEGVVAEDTSGKFSRGQRIHTPTIRHISFSLGKARTLNEEFVLGKINPNFAQFVENSPLSLESFESSINTVKLVKTETPKKEAIWKVHQIVMHDGSVQVALVSFGDGTHKIVVRGSGYGIVRAGVAISEIDSAAMSLLKQLPDSPHKYQPYVDFISRG